VLYVAGKLADQTAKNDDISVELLNLISEKKQVWFMTFACLLDSLISPLCLLVVFH
jgi:hypothetical protein